MAEPIGKRLAKQRSRSRVSSAGIMAITSRSRVAAADGLHAREVTANGFGGALSPDGRWLTFEREQALYAARARRRLWTLAQLTLEFSRSDQSTYFSAK